MNTLIIILVLIFGLSWIGGIIYYGIQSVRSFLRKDIWEFEDNMRSFSTCIFIKRSVKPTDADRLGGM